MKKHILLNTIIYVIFFAISYFILKLFHLMFREWIYILSAILITFGCISGLMQLSSKIEKESLKELLTGSLIITSTLILSIGQFIFVFTYMPEHIVEKDGKKMVAYVNGFFRTYVYYYDYKNAFIVGNQKRIEEDYGDGGFDPIQNKSGYEYHPETTTYFDNKGNIKKKVVGGN